MLPSHKKDKVVFGTHKIFTHSPQSLMLPTVQIYNIWEVLERSCCSGPTPSDVMTKLKKIETTKTEHTIVACIQILMLQLCRKKQNLFIFCKLKRFVANVEWLFWGLVLLQSEVTFLQENCLLDSWLTSWLRFPFLDIITIYLCIKSHSGNFPPSENRNVPSYILMTELMDVEDNVVFTIYRIWIVALWQKRSAKVTAREGSWVHMMWLNWEVWFWMSCSKLLLTGSTVLGGVGRCCLRRPAGNLCLPTASSGANWEPPSDTDQDVDFALVPQSWLHQQRTDQTSGASCCKKPPLAPTGADRIVASVHLLMHL